MYKYKQKEKAAKHIKVISLITGFAYSGVAALGLLIVLLQIIMLSSVDALPDEFSMFHKIHLLFLTYMPIVFFLGIAYIMFGFKFKKLNNSIFNVHLILKILSIIIPIAYSISLLTLFNESQKGRPELPLIFLILQLIFSLFGFLVLFAAFSIPQYFINKKVKAYIEATENEK
jgi:hypothetical protein